MFKNIYVHFFGLILKHQLCDPLIQQLQMLKLKLGRYSPVWTMNFLYNFSWSYSCVAVQLFNYPPHCLPSRLMWVQQCRNRPNGIKTKVSQFAGIWREPNSLRYTNIGSFTAGDNTIDHRMHLICFAVHSWVSLWNKKLFFSVTNSQFLSLLTLSLLFPPHFLNQLLIKLVLQCGGKEKVFRVTIKYI